MAPNMGLTPLLIAAAITVASSARAADDTTASQMNALQHQIDQLQQQLQALQAQVKAAQAAPPAVTAPAVSPRVATPSGAAPAGVPAQAGAANPPGTFEYRGVTLTFGGFVEGAGIYRTRNETADVSSNWNTGIPYPNSPNDHLSEYRGSAHQSRVSLLATGAPDNDNALAAYFESDFQSAATGANSVESNSYNPRLRQAYSTWDRTDYGFELLGGQTWSLLTLSKQGITPRQEEVPIVIDAQYVPGFTWTRNAQFRAVKSFGDALHVGVSLESPQALISSGPTAPLVPTTFNNPGGSGLNATATYSTDIAPDLVAKVAYDPGWGHYEAYGVGRLFRSRADFRNLVVTGGGLGAGTVLPLIPKRLELEASFLAGSGIGRYGSAQLPDVTVKPSGALAAVPEVQALLGVVGHPIDPVDLYLYGGTEQAGRTAYTASNGKPFGYGNTLYSNAGCLTEGSTVCAANTSGVWQIAVGAWWRAYDGVLGKLQFGAEESYTRRNIFTGVGGAPATDENVVMASMRYYPF